MTDLGTIRTAIAQLLSPAGIGPGRVYPTVPDRLFGPSAIISPDDFQYGVDYDGNYDPVIRVRLLHPTVAQATAQNALDDWISPTSAKSAVAAIQTDDRFRVTEARNYGGELMVDNSRYDSVELYVQVIE